MRKVYITVILRAIYRTGFFLSGFQHSRCPTRSPGSEFPSSLPTQGCLSAGSLAWRALYLLDSMTNGVNVKND